jgi:HEPN domain-containing protein
MRNRGLVADHLRRAEARLAALDVLFAAKSWADVVRESQEIVELVLKALLRDCGIEPPRIHDVSPLMLAERQRLPASLRNEAERLAAISKDLRRDRELAFYGTEDLTPSEFYSEQDAVRARDGARETLRLVRPAIAPDT